MKKKRYLLFKFLVEKYNKEIQDEETDLPEDEILDENEEAENDENEEDEPIEGLIAEYRNLYKNLRARSMMRFLKDDKILYDIETMQKILNVPKVKLQRELKKQDIEITKYKNLLLYPEMTLFILMEQIVIEKINNA